MVSTALIGVAALVAATVAAPTPAVADAADTPCSADILVEVNPGVGLEPSSGTFTSNGEEGALACTGKVNGKDVTAGGVGGAAGKYGVDAPNSCSKLDGKTTFTVTATLPTTGDKPIKFSDNVVGQYGPLQGNFFFGGSFKGPKSYGTFKFVPIDSDCFVRPVKKLLVQASAWIVNGSADAAMAERMVLD